MGMEERIAALRQRISRAAEKAGRAPGTVKIVAVTKTFPPKLIEEAFRLGLRHFGENRVQEAKPKIEVLAPLRPEMTWHMVGHLQSNKAKTAVELFDIIQSVDSLKLAQRLHNLAQRRLPIILEVNTSGEAAKFGFRPDEVAQAVAEISHLPSLEIKGLMTIAPLVKDPGEARPFFRRLRELRDALGLEHLSMGMTDDFEVAVEEGATILRIGRAIFGERPS